MDTRNLHLLADTSLVSKQCTDGVDIPIYEPGEEESDMERDRR